MPYLTPETIPTEDACRPLFIPNSTDWLALVSGAISELIYAYNWEQQGAITPEQASQRMFQMWQEFLSEPCGEVCPPMLRLGEAYQWQQYHPDLGTWSVPDGDYTVPAVPARQESTAEDRICLAAANAENVLAQVYESLIDSWQLDLSVDLAEAAMITVIVGIFGSWLGLIAEAAVGLAWSVFVGVYNALGNFFQDAWDADFSEKMRCLLVSVATDNAGVVTFDYEAFLEGLGQFVSDNPIEQGLLGLQIAYMMLWIGKDGLDAAGATTAITSYDCDVCDTWTYVLTPENNRGRFQYATPNILNCSNGTVYAAAPGSNAEWQTGNLAFAADVIDGIVSNVQIAGLINIPADSTITDIIIRPRVWGGFLGGNVYWSFRVNNIRNCTDNGQIIDNGQYVLYQNASLSNQSLLFLLSMAYGGTTESYGIAAIEFHGTGRNFLL